MALAQETQSSDIPKMVIECDSDIGITIGLIDGIIAQYRILLTRDRSSIEVQEAIKDLEYCCNIKLDRQINL